VFQLTDAFPAHALQPIMMTINPEVKRAAAGAPPRPGVDARNVRQKVAPFLTAGTTTRRPPSTPTRPTATPTTYAPEYFAATPVDSSIATNNNFPTVQVVTVFPQLPIARPPTAGFPHAGSACLDGLLSPDLLAERILDTSPLPPPRAAAHAPVTA
jgi:hypothetical protein